MKTIQKPSRKLTLARTTVRSLGTNDLKVVNGGSLPCPTNTVARWVCYSDACGPKAE